MKQFILGLLLLFSINGMAIHVHHFHHYSSPHSRVTTRTKKIQSCPVIKRKGTKVKNTFWRNGVLYYVILNPRRGHVYDNELELCKGCNRVLVKKSVKYCNKCKRLK